MKLHINNKNKGLNGYIHIPINKIEDIHKSVDSSEALEIYLDDILDLVPINRLAELLQLIMSKLRHGGILHITGTDIYEVTKNYYTRNINTEQLNQLILNGKQSGISLMDVVDIVNQLQLKVVKKRLEGFKFCVSGQRT